MAESRLDRTNDTTRATPKWQWFCWFLVVALVLRASLDVLKTTTDRSTGLDPAGGLGVVLLFAGAAWLLLQVRHLRQPAGLAYPLIALVVAGLVSATGSSYPLTCIGDCARLGTMAVLFLVMDQLLTDRRSLSVLLGAVFASAALPLGVALFQAVTGEGVWGYGNVTRVTGTFVHPSPLAMYLTTLLLVAAGLGQRLGGRLRPVALAFALAAGVAIVFTYARGPWIAAFLGAIAVAATRRRALRALLAGAVLVPLVIVFVPGVSDRVADGMGPLFEGGRKRNTLTWRFEKWESTLELPADRLRGLGLGGVLEMTGKAPHNDYVKMFVEAGALGLAAYLWFLLELLRGALRALRKATSELAQGLAAGYVGVAVFLPIVSLSDEVITQLVVMWYVIAVAAASTAATRLDTQGSRA